MRPAIGADACCRNGALILVVPFEALDLHFGLIPGNAVKLLDFPNKPVALSRNTIEVVCAQSSKLFVDSSLELLPIAVNGIRIHLDFFSFVEELFHRCFLVNCGEREKSTVWSRDSRCCRVNADWPIASVRQPTQAVRQL
ncbi:MAG: hypothetical protein ABI728_04325 [Betaproteobacteria bacterium]